MLPHLFFFHLECLPLLFSKIRELDCSCSSVCDLLGGLGQVTHFLFVRNEFQMKYKLRYLSRNKVAFFFLCTPLPRKPYIKVVMIQESCPPVSWFNLKTKGFKVRQIWI